MLIGFRFFGFSIPKRPANVVFKTTREERQVKTHYTGWLWPLILSLLGSVPPRHQRPQYRRTVGESIRYYRKKANYTQEQLAERANLHHNFIGEVERGNMEISLGSMLKIAKALKIKVRDLVRDL